MSTLHPARPGQPPAFVGRAAELEQLGALLEDACTGQGGAVLLLGEPGVGKTRLAEELGKLAQRRGARVLWGRCHEGGGAPAFWPWSQIIRSHVRDRAPDLLAHELQTEAEELARLVPELGAHFSHSPVGSVLDDEQARFRLFDSVTNFLVRAARTQPLVLILDDLHWADTPTLLLLQFLAYELRGSAILVLGTYRDVEVSRDHPLTKTVAELSRLRVGALIALNGLDVADIARCIEQVTGRFPPDALVELVSAETAGNPFFVLELTQLLTRSGPMAELRSLQVIPQTVRGVIRQRLNRLSVTCNDVLDAASVMGRNFSLTRLRRLVDYPEEVLLMALDEAVTARLIAPDPELAGRYRFVHALVRETLYEELTTLGRLRLHHRIGALLEELFAADLEGHLEELSYHFGQAASLTELDKAVDFTRRAADRNMRLLAYEEASRYYERALQLDALGERQEPAQRCELLLALGHARVRSGETTQARNTFERAAETARQVGSALYLARAALGYAGEVVTPGVADSRVIALLSEALAGVGAGDDALRVRLLGRLAMEYRYAPLEERRAQLSREAVAVARRLDDRQTLVFALNARHFALLGPDTLEQRMAISLELAQLARAAGDWELTLQSLPWRLADLLDLGHVQAADEAIEAAATLAEELRQPLYRWYVGVFRTLRALMDGRFADAERMARDAHALGKWVQPGAADVYFAAQMFVLRREQGRIQETERLLTDIVAHYPAMPVIRAMLCVVYSESGRSAEAQHELTRLCAAEAAGLPRDQLWLGAVTALAEAASQLADRAAAAVLFDLLLPYAQRNVVVGVPICFGAAATYLGCLAATLERWPEAALHFDHALEMNARLGAWPNLARTRVHYGATLLRRGQDADCELAARLLEQALGTAQELGMTSLAEKARALQSEPGRRLSAPTYPAGLTPREVEVLRLVAAGNSNKEIATTLMITEPTVERHITNIYAKIGARSRADATVFTLRNGLA